MNTLAVLINKPLPPLPCDETATDVACVDIPRTQEAFIDASSDERQTTRKPSREFLKMVQAMRAFVGRRKKVNRNKMPIVEDEEDEKCECTICLRSQPKPASRDVFAESNQLVDLLNTLPQVGRRIPKRGTTSGTKRPQIPKPNVTVMHQLGVCEEYKVDCEACFRDMKQTRGFSVQRGGDLPEYLDYMLNSKSPGPSTIKGSSGSQS